MLVTGGRRLIGAAASFVVVPFVAVAAIVTAGESPTRRTGRRRPGRTVRALLAGSLPWGLARRTQSAPGKHAAVGGGAAGNLPGWVLDGRQRPMGGGRERAQRRTNLRANTLSWRMWCLSLAAGLVGFTAILALLVLVARLVDMPDAVPITTPPGMPLGAGFVLLAMQSLVAGVTEEAAFRGYMQSVVARRHGIVVAILAQGTLFGLLRAPNHPGAVLLMLPYYVMVSTVYGGLTWVANSIFRRWCSMWLGTSWCSHAGGSRARRSGRSDRRLQCSCNGLAWTVPSLSRPLSRSSWSPPPQCRTRPSADGGCARPRADHSFKILARRATGRRRPP
ncbi:MAG: CPBP family intramembrane glutamic endopeptidase [Vicinamibacterales bacterium]